MYLWINGRSTCMSLQVLFYCKADFKFCVTDVLCHKCVLFYKLFFCHNACHSYYLSVFIKLYNHNIFELLPWNSSLLVCTGLIRLCFLWRLSRECIWNADRCVTHMSLCPCTHVYLLPNVSGPAGPGVRQELMTRVSFPAQSNCLLSVCVWVCPAARLTDGPVGIHVS